MKQIYWTRSIENWNQDQGVFGKHLSKVTHIPCIKIHPTNSKLEGEFDTAIITSVNSLKYAGDNLISAIKNCETVYSHGEKTSKALKALGVVPKEFEIRTAQELFLKLMDIADFSSKYLYPSSKTPAFDMVEAMSTVGFNITSHIVYDILSKATSAAGEKLTESDKMNLAADGVYCFASPSAVRGFVDAFEPLVERKQKSKIVAIGPTTKEALAPHFDNIKMADFNTVEALFEAALNA
jgi:uroporphyrinogen-III synthase